MWPEKKRLACNKWKTRCEGQLRYALRRSCFSSHLFLLPPSPSHLHSAQSEGMYVWVLLLFNRLVWMHSTLTHLKRDEAKNQISFDSVSTEVATLQSTTPYCAVHTYVYFHASTRLYTYVYMSVHVCVHVVYISTSPNWIKIYPKKKKEKETRRFLNVFFERFANKCFPVFLSTQCF